MVDGIVDIPLPGQPLDTAAGQDGSGRAVPFPGRAGKPAGRGGRPLACSPTRPTATTRWCCTGRAARASRISPAVWPPCGRRANRRHRVVCTTAVDFARELADAIESQAVEEFRAKYRTAVLLVFEDLGQLATRKSGKLSAQEELIHTLDALLADEAVGGGDGLGGAGRVARHCCRRCRAGWRPD